MGLKRDSSLVSKKLAAGLRLLDDVPVSKPTFSCVPPKFTINVLFFMSKYQVRLHEMKSLHDEQIRLHEMKWSITKKFIG